VGGRRLVFGLLDFWLRMFGGGRGVLPSQVRVFELHRLPVFSPVRAGKLGNGAAVTGGFFGHIEPRERFNNCTKISTRYENSNLHLSLRGGF
jgi:hypothetical protein